MTVTLEEELGGWGAGEVLIRMASRIRASRGVLVTTHIHPDGDAVGSEIALALGLRRLGKIVRVVNDHPAPEKYRFLDAEGLVEVLEAEPDPGAFPEADLGVLLDASEPSRTGRLEKAFFRAGLDRLCLDHHPGSSGGRFLHQLVVPAAPATGSLILRLLDELGIPIERAAAAALFVAIATDTGWFRFSNASPIALRDGARLVQAGAVPEKIHRRIYQDFRPARMRLLGKLLADLRTEFGGRFAWASLDCGTLEASGVAYEELDGFVEELKAVGGTELVALVVETAPRAFKVSLRSRGDLQVHRIAAEFDGGGHVKAAGFRIEGDHEHVLARLRESVERALSD